MEPNDPHNDPVVKSLTETVTGLGQVIDAEKSKRHRLAIRVVTRSVSYSF